MVHYDDCFDRYHNEPLSCMGAKASQPTHFLKFRLTGFRLNGVDCIVIVAFAEQFGGMQSVRVKWCKEMLVLAFLEPKQHLWKGGRPVLHKCIHVSSAHI